MSLYHWPWPLRPLWDCWACRGAALPHSSAAAPRPDTACPGTEHYIYWEYYFRYTLDHLLKFDVDHGYSKQFGNIREKLQQQHVLYIKNYSEIKSYKSDLGQLNSLCSLLEWWLGLSEAVNVETEAHASNAVEVILPDEVQSLHILPVLHRVKVAN